MTTAAREGRETNGPTSEASSSRVSRHSLAVVAGVIVVAFVLAAAVVVVMSLPAHGLPTSTVSFSVLLALILAVGIEAARRN